MNENIFVIDGLNITGENSLEMSQAISKVLASAGTLIVSKAAKEVTPESVVNLVGPIRENTRLFVVEGKLISVEANEKTVNPYQRQIQKWEDFLEDTGISSHHLPFTTFYFYFNNYEEWLRSEEIDEEDTDFESYMSEIHGITDFSNLPNTFNTEINVSDLLTIIEYNGRVISDLANAKYQIECERDAFELLLQTVDQKRAEFASKLSVFDDLLN